MYYVLIIKELCDDATKQLQFQLTITFVLTSLQSLLLRRNLSGPHIYAHKCSENRIQYDTCSHALLNSYLLPSLDNGLQLLRFAQL